MKSAWWLAFPVRHLSTDPVDRAMTDGKALIGASMMMWTYASAPLRAGLLIAVCGMVLAGCSKKSDEVTTEAPKSQVGAKIGNQVVTVQELDNEFRLANVPAEKRKDPEMIKRVLGELVTRKYLVQQAL